MKWHNELVSFQSLKQTPLKNHHAVHSYMAGAITFTGDCVRGLHIIEEIRFGSCSNKLHKHIDACYVYISTSQTSVVSKNTLN